MIVQEYSIYHEISQYIEKNVRYKYSEHRTKRYEISRNICISNFFWQTFDRFSSSLVSQQMASREEKFRRFSDRRFLSWKSRQKLTGLREYSRVSFVTGKTAAENLEL